MIFTVANNRINWASDNGCSIIMVSAAKVNGRQHLTHKRTGAGILDISEFPHQVNGSQVNNVHQFLDAIAGISPPTSDITNERTGFDMTNERTGENITNERGGVVASDQFAFGVNNSFAYDSNDNYAINFQ